MRVAVGESEGAHSFRVQRRKDLRNPAATVVGDQVNLIDLQCIQKLLQHLGVRGRGQVLAGLDLGFSVREQVNRYATPNIRQRSHLMTPEMSVEQHAVHE